jgi:hypothetical protein
MSDAPFSKVNPFMGRLADGDPHPSKRPNIHHPPRGPLTTDQLELYSEASAADVRAARGENPDALADLASNRGKPETIDYVATAEVLRQDGHGNPAALVEYMADKTSACFETVKDRVHGNPDVTDEAVRKNCKTTTDLVRKLYPTLSYRTSAGKVFRKITQK